MSDDQIEMFPSADDLRAEEAKVVGFKPRLVHAAPKGQDGSAARILGPNGETTDFRTMVTIGFTMDDRFMMGVGTDTDDAEILFMIELARASVMKQYV